MLKASSFLYFLLALALTVCKRDLYKILELKRNSDEKTIRKKFRELSKIHHPDHGGNHDKFIEISKAYNILIDKEMRHIYDRRGHRGLEEFEKESNMNGGRPEKKNIYSEFSSDHERVKDESLKIDLEATLEQLFVGDTMEIKVKLDVICDHCFGSGADSEKHIKKCDKCDGQGITEYLMRFPNGMLMKRQRPCDHCSGKGKKIAKKCRKCNGRKLYGSDKIVTVTIEKGMKDGDKIRLEGESDEKEHKDPGDLEFRIFTAPHKFFNRTGNDLYSFQTISLSQALLGFEITKEGLVGEKLILSNNQITPNHFVQSLKEKGMPIKGQNRRGNLYIEYIVQFPKSLSNKQRKVIEALNL